MKPPWSCLTVFDNAREGKEGRTSGPEASRRDREEARIALRCTLAELRLVDSFVASGEYATRSELLRAALHAFLRSRALSSTPTPPVDADGFVEVAIRLTPEECAAAEAYARHMGNRAELRDTLALIFRYGEKALEVREHARRVREQNREAVETRTRVGELSDSGRDLERKGVVGR
jgi:Arc/MetJ-type ribon-helix-helix transcriptional regulator